MGEKTSAPALIFKEGISRIPSPASYLQSGDQPPIKLGSTKRSKNIFVFFVVAIILLSLIILSTYYFI